ncbi:hypothetical protein LTA6_002528 [Microbacterium sp. LTA6]
MRRGTDHVRVRGWNGEDARPHSEDGTVANGARQHPSAQSELLKARASGDAALVRDQL